jgi:hypothetical protein
MCDQLQLAQAIAMSMEEAAGGDEDQSPELPMSSEDELARAIAMSIADAERQEEEDSDQAQDGADSNQP